MKKRGGYKRGPLFRVEADTRQTLFHSYCSRFGEPGGGRDVRRNVVFEHEEERQLYYALHQQICNVVFQDYCTFKQPAWMHFGSLSSALSK